MGRESVCADTQANLMFVLLKHTLHKAPNYVLRLVTITTGSRPEGEWCIELGVRVRSCNGAHTSVQGTGMMAGMMDQYGTYCCVLLGPKLISPQSAPRTKRTQLTDAALLSNILPSSSSTPASPVQ